MIEELLLTMKEIEVLEDYEDELTNEEISKKHDIPLEEIDEYINNVLRKRDDLRKLSDESKIKVELRGIGEQIGIEQVGIIKVGSQIIKYLSEGIYSSPANSLKEIINNAYDADATEVVVTIDDEKIEITDDGFGMDWRTFEEDFTFIGISVKRKDERYTKIFNRPIIGFLGIGFISVFELCDTLIITSCKKDSKIMFIAEIDFSRYRNIELEEKEFYEISEYKITNHNKETFNIGYDESFTKIELKNLLPGFKAMLKDKHPFKKNVSSIEDIMDYVIKTQKFGITNLGRYWQIIVELAMISPVSYIRKGIYGDKKDKILQKIIKDVENLNFKVKVNNIELYKPFLFPFKNIRNSVYSFDETLKTSIGNLNYYGYFYSQHGIIDPREFIGMLIRVENVAIGSIDRSIMQYPSGANQLFRNWVFGEIYVKEGLQEALNINRNQFKITNVNYITFREKIHEMLNEIIFRNILNIFYRASRIERNKEREIYNQTYVKNIIKEEFDKKYSVKWEEKSDVDVISLDVKAKEFNINPASPIIQKLSIKDQYLFERILLLLEISIMRSKGKINNLKRIFYEELDKWLVQ